MILTRFEPCKGITTTVAKGTAQEIADHIAKFASENSIQWFDRIIEHGIEPIQQSIQLDTLTAGIRTGIVSGFHVSATGGMEGYYAIIDPDATVEPLYSQKETIKSFKGDNYKKYAKQIQERFASLMNDAKSYSPPGIPMGSHGRSQPGDTGGEPMEALSMYALIEHESSAQDYKELKAGILCVGNFGGIAKAIGDTVKKDYSGYDLSNTDGHLVEPEQVEALALAKQLTCINVNNDSQTVLTIVELPLPKMRQYMVAQADTDEEGHNPTVTMFSDDDGNTNIYASAEEALEEIATEIKRIAENDELDHSDLSFGNPQFEDEPEKDFYTNVLKRMPAETGETATVNLPGGSTRTFTIIDFLA